MSSDVLAVRIGEEFNTVRGEIDTKINATLPYSGYTSVSKKLDNFVFQESSSFLNKVADKNRYVKFGDKVVDTYGEELVTNGDFSDGTTGYATNGAVTIQVVNTEMISTTTTTGGYYTEIPTTIGKNYKLDVAGIGIYICRVYEGGGFTVPIIDLINNTNSVTFLEPDGVFTARSSTTRVYIYSSNTYSSITKVSNISVREIQTAQFQVPEVAEIITDGSNTTSVAVNAGDYVVDGSELVANGTFDSDTSGWTADAGAVVTWNNGTLVSTNTNYNDHATQIVPTIVGKKYTVKATLVSASKFYSVGSANNPRLRIHSSPSDASQITDYVFNENNSSCTITFTAITTSTYVRLFFYGGAGESTTWDNISVKQVDETYRATRDTADMYDYTTDDGVVNIQIGDIVYLVDGYSTGGVSNGFYKRIFGAGASNLSTWDYTNTTYWQYLGTASSMSLQNPYFEDRTEIGVTNQQFAYHAYNTLTNSYEGILTETLFSDVSKEDLLDNPTWLARNGFSKVSEFLYSKGAYLVLPVGIWQSLNSGSYHPVFNGFGTNAVENITEDSFGHLWYINTVKQVTSVADCILFMENIYDYGTVKSVSANKPRPDTKYYDICYPDQFIDVREYSKVLTPYEVELIRDDKIENGVEESVSFTYYKFNALPLLSGGATYLSDRRIKNLSNEVIDLGSISNYENSINLVFSNGVGLYKIVRWSANEYHYEIQKSISDVWTSGDYTADFTLNDYLVFNDKLSVTKLNLTKPILSSNTKLSIDLIGSPTNYPQIMLDRLASGVRIVGVNPVLVDDNGNSLISDGTSKEFKLSDKVIEWHNNVGWLDGRDENSMFYNSSTIWKAGFESSSNSYTSAESEFIIFFSQYTSKNNPLIQTSPKPVIEVEPKVIASNDSSIYKGCMMTAQITGKIPTGS